MSELMTPIPFRELMTWITTEYQRDGTAKGGIVIAIAKELGVPVKLAGVGEGLDDLKPFDAKDYVEAII